MENTFRGVTNGKLTIDYSKLTDVIDELVTDLVLEFLNENASCEEPTDTQWFDYSSIKKIQMNCEYLHTYDAGDMWQPPVDEIELQTDIPEDNELLTYVVNNLKLRAGDLFDDGDITLELEESIDEVEFDCEEEYDPLDDDRAYDEWKERGLCE